MDKQYAVVGTFTDVDDDIIIDYCKTLDEAEKVYQAIEIETPYKEYGVLEFIRIVIIEGVD